MKPLSVKDPETIGEFRLRGVLGEGGMGRVYLGFSQAGRRVAVKVVHPHLASDQEFLERFRQEVEAAKAVSGMYTAPVVGAGLGDDPPWMATAFVPGPSLGWVVKRRGPLPDAAIWPLAAGVAEALGAVHAAGVVHRDLSPANVLLADDGPRVIDFGISRALDGVSLTQIGQAMGTPGYMSPERVQGELVGPASDFFSLGCLLAYAATARSPFGDGSSESLQYRVLMTEPELDTVSPRLRQVIKECLRKDPGQRPGATRLIAMITAVAPGAAGAADFAGSPGLGASPGLADSPGFPGTSDFAGLDRVGRSFWPEPVARMIAEAQGEQETVPARPAASAPPAGPSAVAPIASAPSASGPSAPAGPARMIPDGYYLAGTPLTPGSPGRPGHSGGQRAGDTVRLDNGPWVNGAGSNGAWVNGAGGNGPAGSGGSALPGYTPGRRRPLQAEVPRAVLNAIRLMYAGFAVTGLDVILGLSLLGRYNTEAAQNQQAATQMAAVTAMALAVDAIGLFAWSWLATAARRGNGRARGAGTALFAAYSVCALVFAIFTRDDPGPLVATIAVWVIGLAATRLLWTGSARMFFDAWRNR